MKLLEEGTFQYYEDIIKNIKDPLDPKYYYEIHCCYPGELYYYPTTNPVAGLIRRVYSSSVVSGAIGIVLNTVHVQVRVGGIVTIKYMSCLMPPFPLKIIQVIGIFKLKY